MPPKAKFTREEIIKAAVRIVETDGAEALTARNLGAKLGSSARPVFTVFENMSEVFTEVDAYARGVYAGYVNAGLEEALPFKGVGENYIRFAAERPKLFALLFMKEKERIPDAHCVLEDIEDSYEKILNSIQNSYGLDEATAEKLYLHIWIYSHGVAVLLATKVCAFTEREISEMLTTVFSSLLVRAKKGELQ